MLTPLDRNSARRLRAFFEETGYTEHNLRKHLGAPELPSRQLRNHARLLDRTAEPTPLNLLLRWFWIGEGAEQDRATKTIPPEILGSFLESGLLKHEGGYLVPCAMLLHIDGFLVAFRSRERNRERASGTSPLAQPHKQIPCLALPYADLPGPLSISALEAAF